MDPYEFRSWCPAGVKQVIAAGGSNFIGLVDEKTVLKFPHVPPNEKDVFTSHGLDLRRRIREAAVEGLEIEEQILRHLGQHPRVIGLVRRTEDGLLLENMTNGSVESYLRKNAAATPFSQRVKWAGQAADGLAYIHKKGVLHCDISVGNLLLDSNLQVKLCDFQGRVLNDDGSIKLEGRAAENTMSSMPRSDPDMCNERTDMFALGTAIYVMMTVQLPFPDLDPVEDEDEIQRRFRECEFPPLEDIQAGSVIRKCWVGDYSTASQLAEDIRCLVDCSRE
jgi:serine/threonine protein kinase